MPPPSLILILKPTYVFFFLNYSQPYTLKSSVSAQCTFLSCFAVVFFLTFILCISSHKSFWICASGLYYILYIPLTCSHTIIFFICALLLLFLLFYFLFLLYHPSYTRALYLLFFFVNNNVERKAEKLASHFLKQLNWKMVKFFFEILRFICGISNTFIHGEWIYLFILIFLDVELW